MSFCLHGAGVSGGIAIGRAHLVSHALLEVAHYVLPQDQLALEIARFDAAIAAVRDELSSLRLTAADGHAMSELNAFLDLHRMILDDPTLSEDTKALITAKRCNAEWALSTQLEVLLEQFDQIEDPYLRERKTDVTQVAERVLKALLGHPGHIPPTAKADQDLQMILVAHDLSPADVMQYKPHQFAAFLTDLGGATSHTAIVARSLNIPSVVALHHARELINENDVLIVDGGAGAVIIAPTEEILAEYRSRQGKQAQEKQKLKRLKSTVAETLDGRVVSLQANIELPQDIDEVKAVGASGVGLFRSEFLFMNRDSLPDEDEQFEAYRSVARKMRDLPVTVRTLDLGADKHVKHGLHGEAGERVAANPALGLRAIRLCLAEPQMFNTQLRAILRASHYGELRILVPMLSSVAELKQTLYLIDRAKQSLRDERIAFDEKIRIGGMVEIPAAALSLSAFMDKLDFLSIGTNDLIQYTLAIDRADDSVAHLYDPLHPAVLRLVAHTIKSATLAKLPVSVCGEMAGEVAFTRLLLGLGLREFSMHPAQLPAVKQQVLKSDFSKIAPLARRILNTEDPEKIRALLVKINE